MQGAFKYKTRNKRLIGKVKEAPGNNEAILMGVTEGLCVMTTAQSLSKLCRLNRVFRRIIAWQIFSGRFSSAQSLKVRVV